DPAAMGAVEARFDRNIAIAKAKCPEVAVHKIKSRSNHALAKLLPEHAESFDFIYVDGSHQAADVLTDLTLAFGLCRVGGLIACDDYLWQFGQNPLLVPKIAIDSFVNCFTLKVAPLNGVPLDQLWIRKRAA
ncbi:MAG TPA: class I SAM-dependent methyltransferase, partial [Stellaceae bacterium]